MPDGSLKLHIVDVYNHLLNEPIDVFMRHQTLADDPAWRNLKVTKTVTLTGLYQAPQGLYRIEIGAPSYLPVSQFTVIPSSGAGDLIVTLPVNKDRVVGVTFPPFPTLAADAQRLLADSHDVLSFPGVSGPELYDAFDPLRKAGFLNLVTKAGHTRLLSDRSVLTYLERITEQRGDRVFVRVAEDLHSEVLHSVQAGIFHPADDTLHIPPQGFTPVDSYKTPDHFGNLQLTFSRNGAEWSVDMDIDDAQGFEHFFQVVHNALTGQPTHPYNIHEILVGFQELDPGYTFDLASTAEAKTASGGTA